MWGWPVMQQKLRGPVDSAGIDQTREEYHVIAGPSLDHRDGRRATLCCIKESRTSQNCSTLRKLSLQSLDNE